MIFDRIGIIGGGTVACGLAECAASRGIDVVMLLRAEESKKLADTRLRFSLDRAVRADRMAPEQRSRIIDRVHHVISPESMAGIPVIVEAVSESEPKKSAVYGAIRPLVSSSAVLFSTTSSLSLQRLATATGMAERFGGFHVFNPVPAMKLVEIGILESSDSEVEEVAMSLAERLGKTAVVINDPMPGYVVNRLLLAMINHAAQVYAEQSVSAEVIDSSMKLGCRHAMGPLATADLIGLDVVRDILVSLFSETGDTRYKPSPIFEDLIEAGLLGAKTGGGFYCRTAATISSQG